MSGPKSADLSPRPRSDGRRVLFEIVDGDRRVPCSISVQALQDLSDRRRSKPAELLNCFEAARERIEAIAIAKLRARSAASSGLVYIWSEDIDEPPPTGVPAATRRAKPRRTG
jgi:Protein of unknown function (DUF1488)